MTQAWPEYLWPRVEGSLQGRVEADTSSGVPAQLGPRSLGHTTTMAVAGQKPRAPRAPCTVW